MDYDKPLYPYIGMTDGCSVLAKVSISRGAPPPPLFWVQREKNDRMEKSQQSK